MSFDSLLCNSECTVQVQGYRSRHRKYIDVRSAREGRRALTKHCNIKRLCWRQLCMSPSTYIYIYIYKILYVCQHTTPWKPKNVKNFQKVRNWRNWILFVPRVSVRRETKSPWLRQYQSYISNWYVNGKVFTSTTTWEPRNLIFFFKKVRNWIRLVFWLVLKSLNQHSSRSQHAPIWRHRGCIVDI